MVYYMDIVGGLTAFGAYLNGKEQKKVDIHYDKQVKRTPINGLNIYDNYNYPDIKAFMEDLAYKRYHSGLDPKVSGLIPNFYNQLQDVERRNAERMKKFLEEEKKKTKVILEKQ